MKIDVLKRMLETLSASQAKEGARMLESVNKRVSEPGKIVKWRD